jgi:hypothetical protein
LDDLIGQAAASDYRRGAHKEDDEIRHHEKYVKQTRSDQDAALRRYVM